MMISHDSALALAYALQKTDIGMPSPSAFRREFDRSKVFMVMKQNFDDFTRLTAVMDGGHRFDIDSDKVTFNIDLAADWLVGEG
ncbi:hypothetical protein ALP06_02756 [Pseudomonas coronafaciens pv. atropurpurea]|nr:hypothetical protein ALP06_02756 [Pseudomonas coronafaciens pv. atropurpurea]